MSNDFGWTAWHLELGWVNTFQALPSDFTKIYGSIFSSLFCGLRCIVFFITRGLSINRWKAAETVSRDTPSFKVPYPQIPQPILHVNFRLQKVALDCQLSYRPLRVASLVIRSLVASYTSISTPSGCLLLTRKFYPGWWQLQVYYSLGGLDQPVSGKRNWGWGSFLERPESFSGPKSHSENSSPLIL